DMEGFRANPSPVSPIAMGNATTANKRVVQSDMQLLLSGSKLWGDAGKKGAPRNLQDFLSMRVAPDVIAAAKTSLARLNGTLINFCNAVPVSPMVDVKTGTMISVTEWDPTQLTLEVDQARQAMEMLAIAVESRGLKAMSRPFTDLPSGFATDDPTKYDGLYTRNISYWMTSLLREVLQNTKPLIGTTASYLAEGHEDISAPFPNSVAMAEVAIDRLETMVTLEALIGSFAIERRLQSGELTESDIPMPLRTVQKEIMLRSPMHAAVESQYSLAPLRKYFIGQYQPPKELSGFSSTRP
ncbi:MAG: aromatic amino acid lyase, partial [Rubrivivax sp.]